MKAYVHNYVFDIGQLLAYQERMGTEPSDIPATSDISNISVSSESKNETATPTTEVSNEAYAPDPQNNFTVVSEESFSEEFELGGEVLPKNTVVKRSTKRGKGLNIALLVIVLLLLVGFGVLAYYFVYLPLLGEPSVFSDGSGNVITEFLNGLFS